MMTSQRLMSVWETASVVSPSGKGKTRPERAVIKTLATTFTKSPYTTFSSTQFDQVFQGTDVTINKLEAFLRGAITDVSVPLSLIMDEIEQKCWQKSKASYPFSSLKLPEDVAKKLWQIFIRFTELHSYPPVVKQIDVEWFYENLLSVMKVKLSARKEILGSKPVRFAEFIKLLNEKVFKKLSAERVKSGIDALHKWIVEEISMAGWLYKRNRMKANWTSWQARWFVLKPATLSFYEGPKCQAKKGEVVITPTSVVNSSTTSEHSFMGKQMKWKLRLTDKQDFETEMSASSEEERDAWIRAINNSITMSASGETEMQKRLNNRRKQSLRMNDVTQHLLRSVAVFKSLGQKVKTNKAVVDENLNTLSFLPASADAIDKEYDKYYAQVKEKVLAMFLKCDTSGNGFISQQEFATFMAELANCTRQTSDDIFSKIDKDKSQQITFDEFYDYFVKVILSPAEENSQAEHSFKMGFLKHDPEKDTSMLEEFVEIAKEKKRKMDRDMLFTVLSDMNKTEKRKTNLMNLVSFGVLEQHKKENSEKTVQKQLKTIWQETDIKDIAKFLDDRWKTFADFKRYGQSGDLVMTGSEAMIADVLPGSYNLVDLAFFVSDQSGIEPKKTIVKGVYWESSSIPGKSGKLIFPPSFDGCIPVDIGTSEHVSYYGCGIAGSKQIKVSLLYRHGVQDFNYANNYVEDYVETINGAGLETHEFNHLDCPLDDDSGYFILGKMVQGSSGEELHLTAFIVPTRHTLYVPGGTIHSNDYLKGTWRTMLSDEAEINHVNLVKLKTPNDKTDLQPFSLKLTGKWAM